MLNDFKCPACGRVDERFVKQSDPLPECRACGHEMERVITSNYKIRMDDASNRPLGKRYT